jgi:hypothetical protein
VSGVDDRSEHLAERPAVQAVGGEWPRLRGLWRGVGLSGTRSGTNDEALRSFLWGLLAIVVLVAGFNFVNVTSILHDRPGISLAVPIIDEGSSWFTFVLFAFIPFLALRAAPFSVRPRWRFAVVHLPALFAFSALHVSGFVLIRHLFFRAIGDSYSFGPLQNFPYEFRKDVIGYALAVLAFWIVAKQLAQPAPTPADADETTFDIRDGARLIRVPLADILAVTSAGNYVEFLLEDGRRPLIRSPLSALEAELGPRGFVRTHRSWLVNGARVTGLAPEGSGDYRVELGELAVPLSRRFPEALAMLRGG